MEFDPTKINATIVAVSKFQPIEKIQTAYEQGFRHFGENYVQESLPKIEHFKDRNISWHFIGKIQKNKLKNIVGKFTLIHSVDSLEQLKVIEQKSAEFKIKQRVLLQVDVAGETTKAGFVPAEIDSALQFAAGLKNIEVHGLMTMPPLFDSAHETAEKTRPFFRELRDLLKTSQKKWMQQHPHLKELSMGTSLDYQVALEEGATIIRLGTILFGQREKNVSV